MKKIIIFYSTFIALLVSLLVYHGCSELDDVALAPSIETHPDGWVSTSSPNFHGKYIFDRNLWNLNQCKSCHGGDYSGGTAGVSCYDCHSNGPEDCGLCHGNDQHPSPPRALNGDTLNTAPTVGAHNTHLFPDSMQNISAAVECSECHVPVNSFSDPGHIGNSPDRVAEIVFGTLAKNVLPGDTLVPDPNYNRGTSTCSNVYCHGYFKSGNRNNTVKFNVPGSAYCGTCHGDPTSGNPNPGAPNNYVPPHFSTWTVNDCYLCHSTVINSQGKIYRLDRHVNGVVNLN